MTTFLPPISNVQPLSSQKFPMLLGSEVQLHWLMMIQNLSHTAIKVQSLQCWVIMLPLYFPRLHKEGNHLEKESNHSQILTLSKPCPLQQEFLKNSVEIKDSKVWKKQESLYLRKLITRRGSWQSKSAAVRTRGAEMRALGMRKMGTRAEMNWAAWMRESSIRVESMEQLIKAGKA